MIMTLLGMRGAAAFAVSLGASADPCCDASKASPCPGTRLGASASIFTGVEAATASLGESDEGEPAPALKETGSTLLGSAFCSLTFKFSSKG
jgi:hypothetical protein